MDGWMDEWMDGWMDGWMEGWMVYILKFLLIINTIIQEYIHLHGYRRSDTIIILFNFCTSPTSILFLPYDVPISVPLYI